MMSQIGGKMGDPCPVIGTLREAVDQNYNRYSALPDSFKAYAFMFGLPS